MKAKIPGPTKMPFYVAETPRTIVEVIAALLAGSSVVWKATTDGLGILILAIVALGVLVMNSGLRLLGARAKDREAHERGNPMHLMAPLRVLYALVAQRKGLVADDKLRFRVTIHRCLDGMHEQCVPYVGGRDLAPRTVVGRTWRNQCGLVGKVIRSGKMQRTPVGKHVDSYDRYVDELVDLYGYTHDQARQLQPMRLDAVALPLLSEGQVIGVMYADSSDRDFFDATTLDLCIQTSSAFAQHIEMTYTQ